MPDKKIKLGSLFSGIGGFELVGSWYNFDPVWASEIEPAPIRITKRHFPKMKHVGDITKLDGHTLEPVDIITGGSPCFPAETMVLTAAGYIPIADIKVGDLVLTHKGRWKPVTATGSRQAETYLLKGNVDLETTENHPIYSSVRDGEALTDVGEWTKAIDMKSKHWATPMYFNNPANFPDLTTSEYFYFLLGMWYMNGFVYDDCAVMYYNRSDQSIISKMLTKLGCTDNSVEFKVDIGMLSIVSHDFIKFIQKLCTNTAFKQISLNILTARKSCKYAFAAGLTVNHSLCDWDSVDHNFLLTIKQKSDALILRHLFESLKEDTRLMCEFDTYFLVIQGVLGSNSGFDGIRCGNHKWYECTSVAKTGEVKTVYNISVEEDESYIADSIVVHNCQDISVAGNQGGIKLYCPECGESFSANGDVKVCPKCGIDLELTRSGLFMEQIRVIKEMLEVTNHEYPKIIVWENVSAAISSNNGDDFQCVLEEFCSLISEKLPALRPEKWTKSGEVLGKSGSIAWRTLDAQYWGVPQRRRRIFLVVDLRGQCASEILFKSESMRRYYSTCQKPWESVTRKTATSIDTANNTATTAGGSKVTATLCASYGTKWNGNSGAYSGDNFIYSPNPFECTRTKLHSDKTVYGICSFASNAMKSDNPNSGIYKTDVAKTIDTSGTNPTCNQGGNVVVDTVYCLQGNGIDRADTAGCNGKGWKEDSCYTLNTVDRPAVVYNIHQNSRDEVRLSQDISYCISTGGGKPGQENPSIMIEPNHNGKKYVAAFKFQQGAKMATLPYDEDMSSTLTAYQNIAVLIDNHPQDSRLTISKDNICQTLNAKMGTGGGNTPYVMESKESYAQSGFGDYNDTGCISIVRRLTPLECERLQGFPDNWTAEESDLARYKALGNSVALPCVNYIMSGIADILCES